MKLERGVYPDFYYQRRCVEDEASDIFVGRRIQMEYFWDDLHELLRSSPTNRAILAQRKLGKTASLVRFFNVAFWEQDQVVPLYYCFENKGRDVVEVADEMVMTWIGQWLAFTFKDPGLIRAEKLDDLHDLIEKKVEDEHLREETLFVLHTYRGLREECTKGDYREGSVLDYAFKVVINLVKLLKKPCLCIVDEFQETASGKLKDSQGKPIKNPGSIERVAEHGRIWTVVSGSKVSMLYDDAMVGDLRNRISPHFFDPLEHEESDELVRKTIEKHGYDVYEGIEKDVFDLCGGNPFYVVSLFERNLDYRKARKKEKSFAGREELEQVFQFEAGDPRGKIFRFWDEHFDENARKLNAAPPNRPGLSYDVLRYMLGRENVTYQELQREFDLSYEEARDRVRRLREADLVFSVHDPVLRIVLPQIEHKKLSQALASGELDPEARLLMEQRLHSLHHELDGIRDDVRRVEKQGKSVAGDVRRLKGGKLEEEVKKALLAGKGPLNGYRLAGDVDKIYVGRSGRKEREIDLAGPLESAKPKKGRQSKQKQIGLAVEVKDRKSKICIGEAKKFVKAIELYKKQKKLDRVVAIFVNRSGFSKPVQKLFAEHGVIAAGLDDFGLAA